MSVQSKKALGKKTPLGKQGNRTRQVAILQTSATRKKSCGSKTGHKISPQKQPFPTTHQKKKKLSQRKKDKGIKGPGKEIQSYVRKKHTAAHRVNV